MENWKPVKDFEGIYEVSDKGRVRTVDGKVTHSNLHGKRVWKGRVLKLRKDRKNYLRVCLWKNKKPYDFLVHRLVGYAFLEKENGKDLINHKDGNPSNNNVENLEWCTPKHNVNHAFDKGLMKVKEVVLINKKTNEKLKFRSMAKASVYLGFNAGYISCLLIRGRDEVNGYKVKTF